MSTYLAAAEVLPGVLRGVSVLVVAPLPVLVLAAAALGGAALQLGRRGVGISATQKGQRVREGSINHSSALHFHPFSPFCQAGRGGVVIM